jgi:prepilin-type N-terminal cleavage/methylation domain-containing protein/prepilin-type processing-associated H-X9-DG protein
MERTLHRRRRGFSLIELLVVIAIISVLAGMLFPVFARAREAARGAACISNTKQLLAALSMYAQDNDETLPLDRYGPSLQRYMWMYPVSSYVKNSGIWKCPTDGRSQATYDGTPFDFTVSYGYNFLFLNGTPLPAINKPSETIALMDSGQETADGCIIMPPGLDLGKYPEYVYSDPQYRHNGFAIVGWLDGHAKSHNRDYVDQLSEMEDGTVLTGYDRLLRWNRL